MASHIYHGINNIGGGGECFYFQHHYSGLPSVSHDPSENHSNVGLMLTKHFLLSSMLKTCSCFSGIIFKLGTPFI